MVVQVLITFLSVPKYFHTLAEAESMWPRLEVRSLTDMYGFMQLVDESGDIFWLVMRSWSYVIPGCGVLTTSGGIAGYRANRRPFDFLPRSVQEELIDGRKRGGPW